MSTSNNKTLPTAASVRVFIDALTDTQQAADSRTLLGIFTRVTGEQPVMWGSAMIGYGKQDITYASGRVVEWFNVGFSPRKGKLTLYITFDAATLTSQFAQLGKYTIGKGCIYITRLADVDLTQLEKLVDAAYKQGWQNPTRADGKEQRIA